MRTTKQLRYFQTTLPDPEWGHSYKPEHASFCKWSKTLDLYSIGTKGGREARPTIWDCNDRLGGRCRGGCDHQRSAPCLFPFDDIFFFSAGFPWAELGPGVTVCDVGGCWRHHPAAGQGPIQPFSSNFKRHLIAPSKPRRMSGPRSVQKQSKSNGLNSSRWIFWLNRRSRDAMCTFVCCLFVDYTLRFPIDVL